MQQQSARPPRAMGHRVQKCPVPVTDSVIHMRIVQMAQSKVPSSLNDSKFKGMTGQGRGSEGWNNMIASPWPP